MTSKRRLLGLLLVVTVLVVLLTASVVYDSHKHSILRQDMHSIALLNSIMAGSLARRNSGTIDEAVYLDALRKAGTGNSLFLLQDTNTSLLDVSTDAIELPGDVRDRLIAALHDSDTGGYIFADGMKYVWAQAAIQNTPYTLITVHQDHDVILEDFMQDFGLPLLILAVLLFWIVVWISLTLEALFKKLGAQNAQLEAQSLALSESRDQALEGSKAKSTFLANMSHEIRTPLTAVIGYSEALLDSDQTKEDRIEAIRTIHKSSQHVLNIINQILDLSKVEAGKIEIERVMVSPVQLLDEVSALMRMQAREKGLSFDVFFKTPVPEMVITDPTRLKQILLNLFSNAVKFTAEGYVHINVRCLAEKQTLLFEVVDSGIGMSEEQCAHVFGAFTQADASTTRQYGGTGLGLTLARQFAEMLGGGIEVASEPGRGSCFTVAINTGALDNVNFIKDFTPSLNQSDMVTEPETQVTFTGEVLLVEDVGDSQHLLDMYLRKLGATVTVADNGQQAFELAQERLFDLILMDMQMPVMNGLDATHMLREHGYPGPIVALTANVSSEAREQCAAAGCDGFLTKPIDRVRFNQLVSSYLQPSIAAEDMSPVISQLLEDNPNLGEMVDGFVERLPETLDNIRHAMQQPDWRELKELVHQIKGTGGLYGYPGITDIAARLEFQIISQQRAGVEEVMHELKTYCARIVAGRKSGRAGNITHIHDYHRS
jgi:signal transduction histidine kinase/CheY-like chemotaxis protein